MYFAVLGFRFSSYRQWLLHWLWEYFEG